MRRKLLFIFCICTLNSFGQTSQCDSLINLIIRDKNTLVKQFIKNRNLDVNCSSEYESTPLGVAASRGNLDLVKYLLEKGANPDLKGAGGETALFDAVFIYEQALEPQILDIKPSMTKFDYKIKDDIVKLLIKYGADIHAVDDTNTTLLMFACMFERDAVADLLIKQGVDINVQDENGNTALIYAINDFYKINIIKMLLQAGADINIKNNNSQTAVDIAKEKGFTDIFNLLIYNSNITKYGRRTVYLYK